MKAGDIIFVKGNPPLANLVRWFDKGEFSHVGIAVSETHILEADWYIRTRIREMNYENYEVVDLGLNDEQRDELVHAGIDMIGKWYDYPQILWYVLKRFAIVKGTANKFNSPNNLICSELIFYLLFVVGMIDTNDEINNDVTPNQLYRMIQSLRG